MQIIIISLQLDIMFSFVYKISVLLLWTIVMNIINEVYGKLRNADLDSVSKQLVESLIKSIEERYDSWEITKKDLVSELRKLRDEYNLDE